MPELPEVETIRHGIEPHLLGRTITDVAVREPRLRWPVPAGLSEALTGQPVEAVARRAKYLLLITPAGTVILHLGMSGSLRVVAADTPPQAHDHVDLCLNDGRALRLRDPRRFGSLHWTREDPGQHQLLRELGPEPLDDALTGDDLYRRSRGRRASVKAFLMDSRIVVGIGNIYASEALFEAGIHPGRAAGRIGPQRYRRLVTAIQTVLGRAIEAGGTTLRDFTRADGRPGFFRQALRVYGRAGQPCACGGAIRQRVIAQRATYFCPRCQR